MKLDDIKTILEGYERARKLIKEKAKAKFIGDSGQRGENMWGYLSINSIYAENDYVVVSLEYNEPYSGDEEIILSAADLEG